MQKVIEKLETALKKSQPHAEKLATAPPPSKLKRTHKEFWGKHYIDIQITAIECIKQMELHFQTRELAVPWDSEEFLKAWNRYQIYWMEEHGNGNLMSEVRQEAQLDLLHEYAADENEAIKMLRHFINRGDKYIYRVNFEKVEEAKESSKLNLSDEEYE